MTQGYYGQQGSFDGTSDHNVIEFIVRQLLGKVRTGVPVKVISVHGGGVGPAPTVDIQVLVNQIDGVGNQTLHGTIFGIPVLRIQGGANAVICDPIAGDVGWLSVADRDVSSVKANRGKQSNPGSYRRHNLADGIYVGAILNPANPNQYVQFTTTGVKIADNNGNSIVMGPSGINLNGVIIDGSGNISTPGGVTAGAGGSDSVTLQQHKHPGNNLPPIPGT